MELQIFDWDEWDVISTAAFAFYGCTLKTDIPELNLHIGDKLDEIYMDYEHGEMVVYQNEEILGTFDLFINFELKE